jgi:hypothetical protein
MSALQAGFPSPRRGTHKPDPGNALGGIRQPQMSLPFEGETTAKHGMTQALHGRLRMRKTCSPVEPFQGFLMLEISLAAKLPRAMPWADLFCPFGAGIEMRYAKSLVLRLATSCLVCAALVLAGCGEPSTRKLKNRRELEALLTAISLKNQKELDKDIQRIEERHNSGELSDASYKDLSEIIKKARGGDWSGAEKQAYEKRESTPFFD